MSVVELFSWRCQLLRVVLTVFKRNAPALRLYTRALDYELDETDPSLHEQEEEEHTILAKQNPKIASTADIKLPIVSPSSSSASSAGHAAPAAAAAAVDVKS